MTQNVMNNEESLRTVAQAHRTIRPSPNLCDLCQGLTISQLVPPQYYRHAESRPALQASLATCDLCALISYRLYHGVGRHASVSERTHQEISTPGHLCETALGGDEGAEPSSTLKMAFVPRYDKKYLGLEPDLPTSFAFTSIGIWRYSNHRVSDIHIAVEEGDILGSLDPDSIRQRNIFFPGRTIVSDGVPSEGLFDVVRNWLNECEQSEKHLAARCTTQFGNGQDPPLPTRIIDVGEEGVNPRLIASASNQRGRYVALSHCWGGIQLIQTKRGDGSLVQYSGEGIPMSELPKTFHDAVIITRKLGMRYLWIDSLCIIQDDEQDWQRESGRMSTLYWNSTLTISATGAANSTRGCFLPEAPGDAVALPPTFSERGGQAYAMRHQYNSKAKSHWYHKVTNGVVMSRAWTLQERWLSGRILHCCVGQWFWECCESKHGQGGFQEDSHASLTGHVRSARESLSFRSKLDTMRRAFESVYEVLESSTAVSRRIDLRPNSDANGATEEAIVVTKDNDELLYCVLDDIHRDKTRYTHWYREFVSAYSKCHLTKPEDKLPALAGIAAAVHSIVQDTYLAGHWRRDLELSLLWYTPKTNRPDKESQVPSRPVKYRAPSWAWASVDGEVRWHTPTEIVELEIIDVSTTLVQTDNPFGQIKDGRLVVSGRAASARWDESTKVWRWLSSTGDWTIDPKEHALLGLNVFDAKGNDIGTVTFDDALNTLLPNTVVRAHSSEGELKERRLKSKGYAFDAAEQFKVLPIELMFLIVGSSPPANVVDSAANEDMAETKSERRLHRDSTRERDSLTTYAMLLSPVVKGPDTKFVRIGAAVLYPNVLDDAMWTREIITII